MASSFSEELHLNYAPLLPIVADDLIKWTEWVTMIINKLC